MEQARQREAAIRLSGVTKEYRLGQAGTLQETLRDWQVRRRAGNPGGRRRFLALKNVDLTVYRGETLGIIGPNGAGKSTLLKLLSRITAPTAGEIDLYGRVTSMLEVGTGFHGDMTGRENIYMNGAILGMTRAEIDRKLADIIAFSEIGAFLDTPVKRYSSGMYVKLAFSVAAHLDSEILILDEVLAVGDLAFQQKCLRRMADASAREGRTVLYVSHNLSTVRQLCSRCILLEEGQIAFDGDPEEAIRRYLRLGSGTTAVDFTRHDPASWLKDPGVRPLALEFLGKDAPVYAPEETMTLRLRWELLSDLPELHLRVEVTNPDNIPQCAYLLEDLPGGRAGTQTALTLELDIGNLADAQYQLRFVFYRKNSAGSSRNVGFGKYVYFRKQGGPGLSWDTASWGCIRQPRPRILDLSRKEPERSEP